MKTRARTLFQAGVLVGFLGCAVAVSAAVNFTITPAAVSHTYLGNISVTVTGLLAGETVVLQKFADANTNNVIDATDLLVQQGQLTDGKAAVYSGVTNLNVPGDLDTTAGQISAQLPFQTAFQGRDIAQGIVGRYLLKISSPTNHFDPLTNVFAVSNAAFSQAITGQVRHDGTNLPFAIALLFQPSPSGGMEPQVGAVCDTNGAFTIKAPPGAYLLAAFQSNFVVNLMAAPNFVLSNAANIVANVDLIAATRDISGAVVDATNASGIGGCLVPVMSPAGLLAVAFTDPTGNFAARVTAGMWEVGGDAVGLATYRHLALQNKVQVDASAGSVSGVTVAVPKENAIFYGTVKDDQNQPLAGIRLYASDSAGQFETTAITDPDGNYFCGALAGAGWRADLDNSNPLLAGSVVTPGLGETNLAPGQAVRQNFIVKPATNRISGTLRDREGNPISGVGVWANADFGGTNFVTSGVSTDANGDYSLPVAAGNWTVGLACGGGDNSLDIQYCCPGNQSVTVSNSPAVADFTAFPANELNITTAAPLPAGEVGVYYSVQFEAAGCNNNFDWSVNDPQHLPAGLTLYSGGAFNGTPGTNGTFNFSVHVSDGNGNSTNQSFALTITNAPEVVPATDPVPRIYLTNQVAGGRTTFTLIGSASQYYTIEFSTNCIDWMTLLTTNVPVGSVLNLSFPVTNSASFYRAFESAIVYEQIAFAYSSVRPIFYVPASNGVINLPVSAIPLPGGPGLTNEVCLNYAITPGTGAAGVDYASVSGSVCFAPGNTSNFVSIPIFANPTNYDATFIVKLTTPDGANVLHAIVHVQNPRPILAVLLTNPISLIVPDNCPRSFIISNAGPVGSELFYTVADDGALGGFLEFNNGSVGGVVSGQLPAGVSAWIYVRVLPEFATNWIGGDLTTAPSIYTPGAANYTKFPFSVEINDRQTAVQRLLGSWSGTWTSQSSAYSSLGEFPPGETPPSANGGGTWTLTLQQADLTNDAAIGTMTFQGSDIGWHLTYNTNTNPWLVTSATSFTFPIAETIHFDFHGDTLQMWNPAEIYAREYVPIGNFNVVSTTPQNFSVQYN